MDNIKLPNDALKRFAEYIRHEGITDDWEMLKVFNNDDRLLSPEEVATAIEHLTAQSKDEALCAKLECGLPRSHDYHQPIPSTSYDAPEWSLAEELLYHDFEEMPSINQAKGRTEITDAMLDRAMNGWAEGPNYLMTRDDMRDFLVAVLNA